MAEREVKHPETTSRFGPNLRLKLLVLGSFVLIGCVLLLQPTWLFHLNDFRVGNQIVQRVEEFRKGHGRLPEDLKEVGLTDPDLRVFYKKVSGNDYIVWFGTTLGESETYSSQTNKWD